MSIETAKVIFGDAYERANPDEDGRRAAARALLQEVAEAARQANLSVSKPDERTIGVGLIRSVKPTLTVFVDNATIKWGDVNSDGDVDCLIFDPRTKAFSGIWNDKPVDGVERLARFIVDKLKPPKR